MDPVAPAWDADSNTPRNRSLSLKQNEHDVQRSSSSLKEQKRCLMMLVMLASCGRLRE